MRIGLFGGSFDPLHCGHLTLADSCAEQAALDAVWFVPAAHQPLKPTGPLATDADRLAMLQLAVVDRPQCVVSQLEIERGGVSYTVDTLATVRSQHPEAELFFMMGADSLADLPHWHCPEEICSLATLLVVRRAGAPDPDFNVLLDFVTADRLERFRDHQVEMAETPISSSQIRELIATEGDWRKLVPAGVAEYIERENLYR
jgi:nicotinate-nucleotide adenylyltransferase